VFLLLKSGKRGGEDLGGRSVIKKPGNRGSYAKVCSYLRGERGVVKGLGAQGKEEISLSIQLPREGSEQTQKAGIIIHGAKRKTKCNNHY